MSSSNDSLAMQRITKLVDENSFMEIGSLVTARNTDFNLADTDTPSDGVITGYGLIDGNLVYVYSQDASVLNGTIGEMHAKKIANVYDMAMKMGAPVIGFIDCAHRKRHPARRRGYRPPGCSQHDPRPARSTGTPCAPRSTDRIVTILQEKGI